MASARRFAYAGATNSHSEVTGVGMASRFTSIWNEKKPVAGTARSAARPVRGRAGVASGAADSESGDEGDDSAARSLRALKVMFDRGLMSEAEYERRRASLAGGASERPSDGE